jgi:hypothetical protein
VSPIPRSRTSRARRRAVLAATFVALLGTLVLVPAPSFAVEPASRLDQEPLALTAPSAGATPDSTPDRAADTSGVLRTTPDSTPGSVPASDPATDQGRLHATASGVADFGLIAVKLHTA